MQALNIIRERGCLLLFITVISLLLHGSQAQASANTNALEVLDDGTLTLDAEGVPLGILFGQIQEKTGMQFRIHESLLKRPIFVSFRSLPLEEAIKRILHGMSYACIFRSHGDGQVVEIIAFPTTAKASSLTGTTMEGGFPYTFGQEDATPPEVEELKRVMELQPPPDLDKLKEAMGIKFPSEERSP